MKKTILTLIVGLIMMSSTIPQFFYYNQTRKAIAIRDTEQGTIVIKNNNGQTVMTAPYPANSSRWVSVYRLSPGSYTATTTDGTTISFFRRP